MLCPVSRFDFLLDSIWNHFYMFGYSSHVSIYKCFPTVSAFTNFPSKNHEFRKYCPSAFCLEKEEMEFVKTLLDNTNQMLLKPDGIQDWDHQGPPSGCPCIFVNFFAEKIGFSVLDLVC